MKKLLELLIPFLPILATAQGVRFEQGLTWAQIRQKAMQENKYIFVDCLATWCVPCKKMDKEVFSLKGVGDYMNAKFVSVHVQMDTTKNDDQSVKAWYTSARNFQEQYSVIAYPTYLFFSPEGKLVHRYMYNLVDSEFLKTAANALDPNHQYCLLLESYFSGKKDYDRLVYLSTMTKNMGNDSLAKAIALDYLHNYLNKQTGKEFFQKKNLQFINVFSSLLTSKDKSFKVMFTNSKQVDEMMGQKDFAKNIIYNVIRKEEIIQKLWHNKKPIDGTPNWDKLTTTITKKYNQYYANWEVIDAQLMWYTEKNDFQQLIKYQTKKFDDYGLDTAGVAYAFTNNKVWNIFFPYCYNKDTLNKAIGWMEIILKVHPDGYQAVDTYANLLYKVGRHEEGIYWEEKAAQSEKEAAQKENREQNPGYMKRLDKMKKSLPTWLDN